MGSMPRTAVDWQAVGRRLASAQAAGGPLARAQRTLAAPLRTLDVLRLRRQGTSRPVSVPLPWDIAFHGVLPEAVTSALWRMGCYEPATTQFIISTLKPGDVFVDIGAHFGYFTLLASRLVGPEGTVVAIEAMPSTFAMLSRNVTANELANVELHNCAAFNRETTLQFKDYGVVNSSLNTAFSPRGVLEGKTPALQEIAVKAVPADGLLEPLRDRRIAIIKIDAESSEEFVLQGLANTLERHQPAVLLELGGSVADDAGRVAAITGILNSAGYAGWKWRNGALGAIPATDALPYDNYVWLPRAGVP